MTDAPLAALVALAEEPALWLPREPSLELVPWHGFSLLVGDESASVLRIRLAADGVGEALERVRGLLRARGVGEAVWWVGELSTPAGIAERLAQAGLEPGDPPALTSLAIARRPAAEATVEVRRVETEAQYRQALEIDWEAFGVAAPLRAKRRARAAQAWPLLQSAPSLGLYLAYADGEPVGFARAVFTPTAAILMGGATLPAARGRGVYSSTVLARWEETVARGVPRIAVSAGPMSAPVLERLGFEPIGAVRLLRDRL